MKYKKDQCIFSFNFNLILIKNNVNGNNTRTMETRRYGKVTNKNENVLERINELREVKSSNLFL